MRRNIKYQKCSLLVIRLNANGKLVNSKPCKDCLQQLKNTRIKNIYYSNENGEIVCEKIKHSCTDHVSSGNKYSHRRY